MTKRFYHYIFYIVSISVIYVDHFCIKSIYRATNELCDTPFMTHINSCHKWCITGCMFWTIHLSIKLQDMNKKSEKKYIFRTSGTVC